MEISLLENSNLIDYVLGGKLHISSLEISPDEVSRTHFKLCLIDKIVFDKEEDTLAKLTTVFSTINSANSDIVYIFENNDNHELRFYVGTHKKAMDILKNSIKANFNGCHIENFPDDKQEQLVNSLQDPTKSVTISTSIPSLKNEQETKKNFIQGLEKFLLAMQNQTYTAVFLAKNVSNVIEERLSGYEELYTYLFPMVATDFSVGANASASITKSLSLAASATFTKSSSKATTTTTSSQKPSFFQKAQLTGIPFVQIPAYMLKATANKMSDGLKNVGYDELADKISIDKDNTNFDSTSESSSSAKTDSESTSKTTGITISRGETETNGTSQQLTIKSENKFLKNKLALLDIQLKRIEHSKNYGMFDFAAYFLSSNKNTSVSAANIYNALIRGEESYVENSYIESFESKSNQCKYIQDAIAKFKHPIFKLGEESLSITSMINSQELSIALSFPKKSLVGLHVKESVEFGREIPRIDDNAINIGKIYHLGHTDTTEALLPLQNFCMHTLITGSTGSGKSTTSYKLIRELKDQHIKFMVIEPTKGEYKHIFGNDDDVKVYGTNCKFSPLLKINPFNFPANEIHVLEHIDRLVEIFNACWPMYAAMPVILKDSILQSYEKKGWDLDSSSSDIPDNFPSFYDVLDSLETLLDNSMYSDNTKADYKGALITRIKSLTHGLIKNIFTSNALSDQELFDENVIVDLSRVGSSETKSLITGILILKLNEYRIASSGMNQPLKHITILEEAHHILPRVSTQSSQESGNIKGKAVEMLSNAIAEMRTFGQGFIIIDQSPNMLDISAIRNTNTKIIMRLSELEDRQDIGKSAALSDDQINEIPKLEKGIAVIYQNGWDEAVLCKVSNPEIKSCHYKQNICEDENIFHSKSILSDVLKILALHNTTILKEDREKILEIELDNIKLWAKDNNLRTEAVKYILDIKHKSFQERSQIINSLVHGKELLRIIKEIDNNQKSEHLKALLKKQIASDNQLFLEQVINHLKVANLDDPKELINKVELRLREANLFIESGV